MVLINQKSIKSFVTATTITDIYYVLKKSKGHQQTIRFLSGLFDFIDIAGVTKESVLATLTSGMPDFEDAEDFSFTLGYDNDTYTCVIYRKTIRQWMIRAVFSIVLKKYFFYSLMFEVLNASLPTKLYNSFID